MRKNRVFIKCRVCSSTVEVKKSREKTALYCSYNCRIEAKKGHPASNWKGGRLTHKGYVLLLVKGHPSGDRDGYVAEHRLVMEKHIGRYLLTSEVIHHKNHKRNDNRIENLQLHRSQAEHMREHFPKGVQVGKKLTKQFADRRINS